MRGEKNFSIDDNLVDAGSSPHARGKAIIYSVHCSLFRIIPACAGKRLKKYRKIGHPKMPIYYISFSL